MYDKYLLAVQGAERNIIQSSLTKPRSKWMRNAGSRIVSGFGLALALALPGVA